MPFSLVVRAAIVLWLCVVALNTACSPAAPPPNIVLLLADDLGYADLGVHGTQDVATPALDGLAASGMRMTQAYVTAPYCAPSRASLLTGRYQQRYGFEYNPESGRDEGAPGLDPNERTLGSLLQAQGYETAIIGKWHLGFDPQLAPQQHGFDHFFGFLGSSHTYHTRDRPSALLRDSQPVKERAYLTDAFAREAVAFLERPHTKPFFLYLPFNAVHVPLEAPQRQLARFAHIASPERRTYLAMVSALDDAVAQILAALDTQGLRENTIVLFLNDNGASQNNHGSNAPLRGSKLTVSEGGVRVPFFVRWPGVLDEGSTYAAPVSALDVVPTLLAAAGASLPTDRTYDGVDLAPHWSGARAGRPHEQLFWRAGRSSAVRAGDLKLVRHREQVELFDLASDPGEQHDLAAAKPAVVARLRALYDDWEDTMRPPAWTRAKRPFRRWRDE
jgi:arylsulfatase A-like enzyme